MRFNDQVVRTLPIGKYFDDTTPSFGIRVGKKPPHLDCPARLRSQTLSEARTKGKLASPQLNNDRITFEAAYDLYKKTQLIRLKVRTQSDNQRFLDR